MHPLISHGIIPSSRVEIPATVAFSDTIAGGVTITSINDTISIGSAPAAGETRHVIVFLFGDVTVHRTWTDCTIGGVTATKLIEDGTSDRGCGAVFIAEVPTGTTAAVVANLDAFVSYGGGVAYVARNLQSATPIDSHFASASNVVVSDSNIDEPSKGFVVAAAGAWTNVAGSFTWSGTLGLTEDADANVSGTNDLRVTGASKNISGSGLTGRGVTSTVTALVAGAFHRLFTLEMR